jgi:hypothetical protein
MLFSLQNDRSPFVTFQLRVRELKDMHFLGMWSIQGLSCVPIGYLIDAYFYIDFMSNVCCNMRGLS